MYAYVREDTRRKERERGAVMSMLKEIIVHVAIASVLLGSLKKAGVITYETRSHSFCLSVFSELVTNGVGVCVYFVCFSLYSRRASSRNGSVYTCVLTYKRLYMCLCVCLCSVHESSPMIPNATARKLLMTAIAFGEAVAGAAVDGVVYTKRVLAATSED